jgi:hypothetical protein
MRKVISIKLWAVRINRRVLVLALGLMETGNGYTCFNQPHFTMNFIFIDKITENTNFVVQAA